MDKADLSIILEAIKNKISIEKQTDNNGNIVSVPKVRSASTTPGNKIVDGREVPMSAEEIRNRARAQQANGNTPQQRCAKHVRKTKGSLLKLQPTGHK